MNLGEGCEVSKAKGRKGGKKAAVVRDDEDSVNSFYNGFKVEKENGQVKL